MHLPFVVSVAVLIIDLPWTFSQTPPTSVKANTSPPKNSCPVLETSRNGRNLIVDLLPNKQCQLVVSVTTRKFTYDKLVRLIPRTFRKDVRDVHFIEGSFRRGVIRQMPGFPPVRCPPFNIQMQSNTIIIETRPRDCYISISHKEVLTPVWNPARRMPVFTNQQSYEVNSAGPFLVKSNFPVIPSPSVPSTGQTFLPPNVPVLGQNIPRPSLPSTGHTILQPNVPVLGQNIPRPSLPSTVQTFLQPNVPVLGQTIPPAPPQTGVQTFMPLTFPMAQTPGVSTTKNTGQVTTGGGPPPPVPVSLTSDAGGVKS